jgi:hypothetical protein
MKKYVVLVLIIIILSVIITGCFRKKAEPDIIQEFRSLSGNFLVLFPEHPVIETQKINTLIGVIDAHMSQVTTEDMYYAVSYSDYPADFINSSTPDEVLNGARDGALDNTKGKLLQELIITYEDYPGRDLKYEITNEDESVIVYHRILLVNERLYQIIVVTEEKNMFSRKIFDFLESFKLVDTI